MSLLDKFEGNDGNHNISRTKYLGTVVTDGSALLPEVTSPDQPPHTQLSPTTPPPTYLPFVE
jgi:hypothetical protein